MIRPAASSSASCGAAVEEALELGQPRRQRRKLCERALGVALVLLRTPYAHARLQVHGHRQHHALGQRRSVAGRHREPVLRVERMVEGAAKGDHWEAPKLVYRAGVEEWEEPLHPGSLPRTYPTFSHNATLFAHLLPLFPSVASHSGKTPANRPFPQSHAAPVGGARRCNTACNRSRRNGACRSAPRAGIRRPLYDRTPRRPAAHRKERRPALSLRHLATRTSRRARTRHVRVRGAARVRRRARGVRIEQHRRHRGRPGGRGARLGRCCTQARPCDPRARRRRARWRPGRLSPTRPTHTCDCSERFRRPARPS